MSGGSVVAQLNPNGQFYWLHLDHLGSGRKMTDTSGAMTYRAEFDPYGKLLYEWSSPTNLNTKKFTGYERDAATNLDYAQARMYSSDWGRFMSPDPAGLRAARLTSPKSLNRYSYVNGDPVNFVDPSGYEAEYTFCSWWDYAFTGVWAKIMEGAWGCSTYYGKAVGNSGGGGGGGGGGKGGAGGDDFDKQNAAISNAVDDVFDILGEENDCSKFLGGSNLATMVLQKLDWGIGLVPGVVMAEPNEQGQVVASKTIGIQMSGLPQQATKVGTWGYRLPEKAIVNTQGPFFNSGSFGSYGSSSRKGRALAILHELSHLIADLVFPDGTGAWQIPNDKNVDNKDLSQQNTKLVESKCKKQLEALK